MCFPEKSLLLDHAGVLSRGGPQKHFGLERIVEHLDGLRGIRLPHALAPFCLEEFSRFLPTITYAFIRAFSSSSLMVREGNEPPLRAQRRGRTSPTHYWMTITARA